MLNYGFAAGSVNFQETDTTTVSIKRGKGLGFEGGVTLARQQSGRMGWVINLGLAVQQIASEITISTSPSTTSSQPGAIVFATPAGSPTIVISTISGVPSSLSTSVTGHKLVTARGWSAGPVVRFGVTF